MRSNIHKLTGAQKRSMNLEIMRQLAEYDRANSVELDAIVLWILHERFGFGPTKLRRFHDEFVPAIEELAKSYEMGDGDHIWLCTRKLKEYGVDVEKWHAEREERNG